jgi:hypothetical protein
MTPYLVHAGYALMLCALLARDMLWLRGVLVGAQGLLAVYAWRIGVPSIAVWNVLFTVINGTWAAIIFNERRAVNLPPDLEPLYTRHFAALTPPEFIRLWRRGRREVVRDCRLARSGEYPEALYFLMSGTVRVSRNDSTITELSAGYFVAEMSLLTGRPATADVDAVGTVDAMSWPTAELGALRAQNPILWTKIQSVIGHDLVEKIQRAEARPAS